MNTNIEKALVEMDAKKPKSLFWQKNKKRIIWGILILFVTFIVLALRELYQYPFLVFRKYIAVFILGGLLLWLAYKIIRSKRRISKKPWLHWTLKGVLPLLIVGFLLSWTTAWVQHRYHEAHMLYLYNRLDKQEITQMPLTKHERIHPRNNIQTMAYSQLGNNFDISVPQLIMDKYINPDGTTWSMAVLPIKRNFFQPYEDNITDLFAVPADKTNPDFAEHRYKTVFNTGESMKLDKNAYTNALKVLGFLKFFYMEPDDVYYMHDDQGNWVQVVSLIKWTGFLFPIPKFGGVIVTRARNISWGKVVTRTLVGDGTYISPDEMSKYPYLDGNNLFSEDIARIYAESFTYKEGYYHAKMDNASAVEIPTLPKDENKYPFVSYYDWSKTSSGARNGLYHYISLEPVGENHKGMAYSIFIRSDGRDKIYYYDHVKAEDGVGGVTSMPNIIRSYFPTFDWDHSVPSEFRTYMPDIPEWKGTRNFFWLGSIVTISKDSSTHQHDGATLAKLVAVNGRTKDVIELDSKNPLGWTNQVRVYYQLPIIKDTIPTPKVIVPQPVQEKKVDTIYLPAPTQSTPIVAVPEKKDTVKKEVVPTVVQQVEVKKDTPVVKQPVVKPKQKSKKKKKG